MRERAQSAVESLQEEICDTLERHDGSGRFQETVWSRDGGGGGKSRMLLEGDVFEKAGVNVSAVHGEVPKPLRDVMAGEGERFFATGISLVIHPRNPHVPTVHANFRYIERGEVGWFGGGGDLTPHVLYDEDARHFHDTWARVCDAFDPTYYPRFKAWCDRYFFLPHRSEARGIGGVFFDHIMPDESHDREALFGWWTAMGEAWLGSYLPIVERRKDTAYDEDLRRWQLQRRGRYVEFNLLHDRGTAFGLRSGGRTESILMSLPALVRWDSWEEPKAGTNAARLLQVLREPVAWRSGASER